MDLLLWRHAEAKEAAAGTDDLLRELTPRDKKQARRMARWLEHVLPSGCRILVSPARRTVQTAEALGRRFHILGCIGPQASPLELVDAAGWPNARSPVLIVGHQPAIGGVASLLLTGTVQPMTVRKSAVWWIGSRSEEPGTYLKAVVNPEVAKGLKPTLPLICD